MSDDMAEKPFEELRHDAVVGDSIVRWECDVPSIGQSFQVLEQEWLDTEPPVRVIKKVKLRGWLMRRKGIQC